MSEETKEEMILISQKRLDELLKNEAWLYCLEAAGVDNWCGYEVAQEMLPDDDD